MHDSFESWFTGQLLAAGAPMDFIETWDPRGMLDDLVDLGCASGAASPPTGSTTTSAPLPSVSARTASFKPVDE